MLQVITEVSAAIVPMMNLRYSTGIPRTCMAKRSIADHGAGCVNGGASGGM